MQVAVTLQNQPARTVIGENTLADAYILESRGHAPAEHLAALGILSFVFLECFSQTFFALVDGIHHTHAVFEHLTADRGRTRIDGIAPAQLERVDIQLFRHHVHRSFNGDRRLIDAVAAERTALQVIIANRRAFHLDIGNDVRAAAHQRAGHQRAVAFALVRSAVREHSTVQILELAVRRKADLVIRMVAVAFGGEDQILLARQRNLDRLAAGVSGNNRRCFKK